MSPVLRRIGIAAVRAIVPVALALSRPHQPHAREPAFSESYLPTDPPAKRPVALRVYVPSDRSPAGLPVYVNLHGAGSSTSMRRLGERDG